MKCFSATLYHIMHVQDISCWQINGDDYFFLFLISVTILSLKFEAASVCFQTHSTTSQEYWLKGSLLIGYFYIYIFIFIYFNHEFELFFTLTFQAPNNPTIAIRRAIVIWCLMAFRGSRFTEELLKEYHEVKQVHVKI